MALQTGFRTYDVISVLADVQTDINQNGAAVYLEVTNAGATTAYVTVNSFPEQGHQKGGIPVLAGTTRVIPMTAYNLMSTADVTVVAYRL